jgi:hypothetical protein
VVKRNKLATLLGAEHSDGPAAGPCASPSG